MKAFLDYLFLNNRAREMLAAADAVRKAIESGDREALYQALQSTKQINFA